MRFIVLYLLFLALAWSETLESNYFHPNQWRMYNPIAKELDISSNYSISVVNTSIYETESYYPDYIVDIEVLALLTQAHFKLSSKSRIDISLPLYAMSGGIMDGLVNGFHKLLNIHTPRDRNQEVYNQIRYLVKEGNQSIIDISKPYRAIGNAQIDWIALWYEKEQFKIATQIGIKVPLNQDKAVTSGTVDVAWALLASYDYKAHHLMSNLMLTFNGDAPIRSNTPNNRVRFFYYLGYNYTFYSGNRFILEFKYSTPPYDDSTIEYFYEISSATNIGYSFKLSKKRRIQLFALEDNAPYKNYSDISFGLNFKQNF